jgi:hypothetical protein
VAGVVNSGSSTVLSLHFSDCLSGPQLVGEIAVEGDNPPLQVSVSGVELDWASSVATYDCGGAPRPTKVKGFNCCSADSLCGEPYVTPVDRLDWGQIKTRYRR